VYYLIVLPCTLSTLVLIVLQEEHDNNVLPSALLISCPMYIYSTISPSTVLTEMHVDTVYKEAENS
jgi:hypothetical protein